MMALVERWRSAGPDHVDFATSASDPVVGSWLEAATG